MRCKKYFCGILCSFIILVCAITIQADSVVHQDGIALAEEKGISGEKVSVACAYNNRYGSGSHTAYFDYSDAMLVNQDAKTFSADLSLASVALASAAYKQSSLENALLNMGFESGNIITNGSYGRKTSITSNDSVAYAIAKKRVGAYYLYVVPVRGTPESAEWYSNFNLGTTGNHAGFYTAAKEVMGHLMETIRADGADKEHTIIWTMGHSRGAAVANIIAGAMTDSSTYATANHIFGYTYACPAVSKSANVSYTNIYNYNNPGDLIPELPLEQWGYKRYGVTIQEMSGELWENEKLRFKTETSKSYAATKDTSAYINALTSLINSESVYNSEVAQFAFTMAGYALGGKKGTTKEELIGYAGMNFSNALDEYVMNLLTGEEKKAELGKVILQYEELREKIAQAQNTISGMTEKEQKQWLAGSHSLIVEIEKLCGVKVLDAGGLVRAKNQVIGCIQAMDKIKDIYCCVMDVLISTDGKVKEAIDHGHSPEMYVLWLNAVYYGDRGWYNNDTVKSAYILKDMAGSSVGYRCFDDCDALEEIVIGDGVESAGRSAFHSCDALKKVTMPVDMSYSGGTFSGTRGVKEIHYTKGKSGVMPDKAKSLYDLEYCSSSSITTVEYGEGITRIGNYATYYCYDGERMCKNLENLSLPESLTEIGDYAFYGAEKAALTGLPKNVKVLGKYAFAGSGIKRVEISSRIQNIPDGCFSDCDSLEEIVIGDGVESAKWFAFSSCDALKKVTMPVDMSYSGGTFSGTRGVKEIHYTKGKSGVMPDRAKSLYDLEYCSSSSITTVEYGEGITRIGNYATYYSGYNSWGGCKNLENLILPESLTEIGDYAFYGAGKAALTGLPKNVKVLGKYAFAGSGIKQFEISSRIQNIPDDCFSDCDALEEIVIGDGVESAGEYAFSSCDALKKVTMPVDMSYESGTFISTEGVTEIHYTKGKSGVMPDKAQSLRDLEYYSSNAITTVEYGEGIIRIGNYATYYKNYNSIKCKNLENLSLPESLTEIGDYAFYGAEKAVLTGLPESLTKIGDYAFYGAEKAVLTGLPESLTEIGDYAFYGAEKAALTGLPGNVKVLGEYALAGSGIKRVEISSRIQNIPDGCFSDCDALEEIVIRDGVESAGWSAFSSCDALKKVTMPVDVSYGGTFSGTRGVTEIHYTKGKSGVMPDRAYDTHDLEYYSSNAITTVVYGEGITRIGNYAMYYCGNGESMCKNLENLILPESLTEIGDYAFHGAKKAALTGLPGNVKVLGEYAFAGSGIKRLEISSRIQNIPDGCFSDCDALEEIVIRDGVESAGIFAFSSCDALKKVTMPVDMSYDGWTFNGTEGVTELHYTKGKSGVMPDRAYEGYDLERYSSNSITTVEYGEGITRIGNYAMNAKGQKFPKLKNIKFSYTIETISDTALKNTLTATYYGYKSSEAERFAKENGIAFICLHVPRITSTQSSVMPGDKAQFTAKVYTDIDTFTEDVEWSVEGNESDLTMIDTEGVLTVSEEETAKSLKISACTDDYDSYVNIAVVEKENAKIQVTMPETIGSEILVSYNGGERKVPLTWDENVVRVTGHTSATEPGVYTCNFNLVNPDRYEWENGTTECVRVDWKIYSVKVTQSGKEDYYIDLDMALDGLSASKEGTTVLVYKDSRLGGDSPKEIKLPEDITIGMEDNRTLVIGEKITLQGGSLSGIIENNGIIKDTLISGTVINNTEISDCVIEEETVVTGGKISGDTENRGVLSQTSIAGNVTGSGIVKDSTVLEKASLTGGVLDGTIINQGSITDSNASHAVVSGNAVQQSTKPSPQVRPTGTPLPTEQPANVPEETRAPDPIETSPFSNITGASPVVLNNQNQISKETELVGKPGKVNIKSAKNKSKCKVTIQIRSQEKVSGYQIQYSLNKKLRKAKSKITSGARYTISRLKLKKTYYIRVRAYKLKDGKKLYGAWSSVKKIKINK